MEITNQKIIHKKYGEGKVVSCNDEYVVVRFADGEKKFVYPNTFEISLQVVDPVVQASIIEEINNKKAKIIAQQKEEADRKAKQLAEEELAKKSKTNKEIYKEYIPKKRVPGKPMLLYVFQGNTYEQECRGGYLWAPITNTAGSNIHHWNRLLDVREGDIILHGCDGKVVAISRAKGPCYESQRPYELSAEELWDKAGRRVDCEYYRINRPITTADYKDEIIKLSAAKYSPFNKDGGGNMGYLFEINSELAHLFITETVKTNQYLLDNPIVKHILQDNK